MKRPVILILTIVVILLVMVEIVLEKRASHAWKRSAQIVLENQAGAENACWKKGSTGDWVFSNADYYSVLRQIDASTCSKEFQGAWANYVEAVRARSEASPVEKIREEVTGAGGYGGMGHPRALSEAWDKFWRELRSTGAVERT